MTRKRFIPVNITTNIAAVMLLAACNGSGVSTPAENPSPEKAQSPVSKTHQTADSMNLTQQIDHSKQDLAQRLGVNPDSILVNGVRKVNWRTGALGCPEPGMNYITALVPGILILLEVDGDAYGYHASSEGKPFFCPKDKVEKPASIQAEDLA